MIEYYNKIFDKFINEHGFIGCHSNDETEYLGVEFKYNKYGHRERQPEEYSDSDYILVGGCSVTEGVPIEVKDRYTSVVERLSGIPIYNIGMGSCGYDAIVRNIINWLSKHKENKPIHVVTLMPSEVRVISKPKHRTNAVESIGSWSRAHQKFVVLADKMGYFQTNAFLQYQNLKSVLEMLGISYTFITHYNDQVEGRDEYSFEAPLYVNYDRAIDNLHPGEAWHEAMGIALYQHLKTRNIGVR